MIPEYPIWALTATLLLVPACHYFYLSLSLSFTLITVRIRFHVWAGQAGAATPTAPGAERVRSERDESVSQTMTDGRRRRRGNHNGRSMAQQQPVLPLNKCLEILALTDSASDDRHNGRTLFVCTVKSRALFLSFL
ncbi:hypothetical protein DFH06DRAFT_1465760 [Mycena polygramma]|nr:hypothetical protein DFH06DRAFT_1465760 [Mycena polygramma]